MLGAGQGRAGQDTRRGFASWPRPRAGRRAPCLCLFGWRTLRPALALGQRSQNVRALWLLKLVRGRPVDRSSLPSGGPTHWPSPPTPPPILSRLTRQRWSAQRRQFAVRRGRDQLASGRAASAAADAQQWAELDASFGRQGRMLISGSGRADCATGKGLTHSYYTLRMVPAPPSPPPVSHR